MMDVYFPLCTGVPPEGAGREAGPRSGRILLKVKFHEGGCMKKVAVIMGSASDLPVAQKAVDTLKEFGVPCTVRVLSAHRTAEQARTFAVGAREKGYGALIAVAGMAAHLAGALAANTTLPVVGVPAVSGALGGMDALLSTVQMPPGIPVAAVAINGGKNAALLCVQMLSLSDESLADKLAKAREIMEEDALKKDAELQQSLSDAEE